VFGTMDVRLLTDTIVRQTTVLLAQVATAAGLRAPLAHVAGEVFLNLARELEAQGVRRKVVADMFGLALRSYELKMKRLLESSGVQHSTWHAVLSKLEHSSLTRRDLEAGFPNVSPRDLSALLNDLVDGGFLYRSGTGPAAVFRATTEADRARFADDQEEQSLANILWLTLSTQGDRTEQQLRDSLRLESKHFDPALRELVSSGRVQRHAHPDGAVYEAVSFRIPVGAEQGWEAAVCDHYGAVATALACKLQSPQSRADDTIGGATTRFTVHSQHPLRADVLGLLKRVRAEVSALWQQVHDYNQAHPPPEGSEKVTFYYGQSINPAPQETDTKEASASPAAEPAETDQEISS